MAARKHGKHGKDTPRAQKGLTVAACVLAACLLAIVGLTVKFSAGSTWFDDAQNSATPAAKEGNTPVPTTTPEALLGSVSDSKIVGAKNASASEDDAAQEGTKGAQQKVTEGAGAAGVAGTTGAAEAAQDMSAHLSPALVLEHVPADKEVRAFSINAARTNPELTQEARAGVQDAVLAIEDAGYACSALLLDVQSGCGLAYNADEAIYTASSFKAPLSDYVLENGLASEWDLGNIEASILYSDNDAFEALATAHMGAAYEEWVGVHGIAYDGWSPWYPKASAKAMAACWVDIYHYIHSADEQAAWFGDLLANTNLSFIRSALEGLDVHVQNKAGWLTDDEFGNSVSDCALVRAGGRDYLLIVMSSQPSWGEAHERVQNLARALFTCREFLN